MLTIGLFPHPIHPLGCPPHRLGISLRGHGLPDGRHELSVRLAERAAENATAFEKVHYNFTLAAALYRAGQFEAAIDRLEQGTGPTASAFLALAHHRLGHHDEARRWLNTARDRKADPDPNAVWEDLEVDLLQSEAEGVILYDPVFPADPFAH